MKTDEKMEKELTLFTEDVIDAAHKLVGYNGKCSDLHGHSWLLRLWIRGRFADRDRNGILFDFTAIGQIKDSFDHSYINELFANGENPTAENICMYVYEQLKDKFPHLKFKVRIYETAVLKKSYAEIADFGAD